MTAVVVVVYVDNSPNAIQLISYIDLIGEIHVLLPLKEDMIYVESGYWVARYEMRIAAVHTNTSNLHSRPND